MKMFLLQVLDLDLNSMEEDSIELDLHFTVEYKESLERFVKFCGLVYAPYFLSSSIGADAPMNDLNLYRMLHKYEVIDRAVSEAGLVALSRHLFCLIEELVVFSFFSSKVDSDMKSHMAARLLSISPPTVFVNKKPMVPKLGVTSLAQTAMLFQVLELTSEWLQADPEELRNFDSFCEAEQFVRSAGFLQCHHG